MRQHSRGTHGYFQDTRVLRMGIPNEVMILIRYACKDMGLKCSFILKGEILEEVTRSALAHVKENHADEFNRIETPVEITQMEQALSRSTRVVVA